MTTDLFTEELEKPIEASDFSAGDKMPYLKEPGTHVLALKEYVYLDGETKEDGSNRNGYLGPRFVFEVVSSDTLPAGAKRSRLINYSFVLDGARSQAQKDKLAKRLSFTQTEIASVFRALMISAGVLKPDAQIDKAELNQLIKDVDTMNTQFIDAQVEIKVVASVNKDTGEPRGYINEKTGQFEQYCNYYYNIVS